MLKRIKRLPSPALVISAIALIVAVGGGTFAFAISDNAQDKKIARKQVRKLAPTLSVKSAKKARSAKNAQSLQGSGPAAFLGAKNVEADGFASSTDIDNFTSGAYTDIATKAFTAPTNGFIFIAASLSSEDDITFAGSGNLFYRLRLDAAGLTNDSFYHQIGYDNSVSGSGGSGGITAVAPVAAGPHTVALQARETGTGSFLLGRDVSVLFVPNGSASAIPFTVHGSAKSGGGSPQG